ncbi:hypothetical protein IQ255_13560 [Pleurocapsales cyanobacterium LEGE 10410]|nr:hypothetical protein [Pleurocapsales cyanobacterium LEGE 10410]
MLQINLFPRILLLLNYLEAVSNLFVSLCLSACVSFAAPTAIIGCILGFLSSIGCVPGLMHISQQGTFYVLNFLAVFGNGKPLQGMITLGVTVSIVGILLDVFNFYRYPSLNDKDFS